MKETVKIKGSLAERVRNLLGGANPTPKRVETLFSELEQRRGLSMAGSAEVLPPEPGEEAAMQARSVANNSLESAQEPPLTAPPAPESSPPANWQEERKLLHDHIKGLEKRIDELRKPPTVAEREEEEAVATGKLPPPGRQAPPAGMPTRQLGPKVFVKLCTCGQCTESRRFHWFCCICRSGPHHYQQRYAHYTKNWYEPGSVRGISHHVCSEPCRMQYLGLIGVTPGVNDAEPPTAEPSGAGAPPSHPRVALDSE